jgi:hypothetical protein
MRHQDHGDSRPPAPLVLPSRAGCPSFRRGPAEHYADAERLLAAAESSVTEQIQTRAALIAIADAVLTLSPRRARRVERPAWHAGNGLPPHLSCGDDS